MRILLGMTLSVIVTSFGIFVHSVAIYVAVLNGL
jgi:hypothetical protein